MKNLVIIQNNQVITTSLKVAEVFGKRHSDVLRTITNLYNKLSSEHERNFAFSQNSNISAMFKLVSQNMKTPTGGIKNSRMYIMNRDGFVLLAMGFTGKKALEFKLAYITAFNQMEATLSKKETLPSLSVDMKAIGGMVKKCVNKALVEFLETAPADKTEQWQVSDQDLLYYLQNWHYTRNKKDFDKMRELVQKNDQLLAENADLKNRMNQISNWVR